MFRTLLFVLFTLPWLAQAKVSFSELMLQDETGKMLSQVSSLTKFKNWIVVLVQDKNTLYIVDEHELRLAFEANRAKIQLSPITLPIDKSTLATTSWEAIEFAEVDQQAHLFLFHEHDSEGDNHQIFSAQVQLHDRGFKVQPLQKLGEPLPLLQNDAISLSRRENYGYEAIVWSPLSQQLILLPELRTQPKYALSLNGERQSLGLAKHNLRASDMASINNHCAITTSFCYQSKGFKDALCEGNNGTPKLSLATYRISKSNIQLTSSVDYTKDLLAVGYDPSYSTSQAQARTFNAEGITQFANGFLLVNDNKPQGKARSVIRYLTGVVVDSVQCKIK